MKTRFLILIALAVALVLGLPPQARADYFVTLTVTVTNASGIPTNGSATLTVNGDTRTATNNIASNPSKLWLGTNALTKATTNLYSHIALNKFGSGVSLLAVAWKDTNAITLYSQINQNISANLAGSWGSLTLTTNLVTNQIPVVVPAATLAPATGTNIGNGLADFLNLGTNKVSPAAQSLANYVALYTWQTISNKLLLSSTNRNGSLELANGITGTNLGVTNWFLVRVVISESTFNGILGAMTNGVGWSNIFQYPTISNALVNAVGGILSNVTIYTSTTNYLKNLVIRGGINVGGTNDPPTLGSGLTAIGSIPQIIASGMSDTAGFNPVLVLQRARGGETTPTNVLAGDSLPEIDILGKGTTFYRSAFEIKCDVVSDWSNTTADTLVHFRIGRTNSGSASDFIAVRWSGLTNFLHVYCQSNLTVAGMFQSDTITNATLTGTNNWNGDISYARRSYTGLGNGVNTGIELGTNAMVELSGATTIATIGSFISKRHGATYMVRFSGAVTNIISNESLAESVNTSYRIKTGTGGDVALTNSPAWATFSYNATVSRWELMSSSR